MPRRHSGAAAGLGLIGYSECAHDAVRVHRQVARRRVEGTLGLAGALHRSVPVTRRADASRDRPDRRGLLLERGARKHTGGDGWADVWKRHHFAWEYKGKRKDLNAAFGQLRLYALALENPPLLLTVWYMAVHPDVLAQDVNPAIQVESTEMKDFDRFSHAGVKNELLRLRHALSARSPGVEFGSSGDGEITIKGSNATAYARKYKRGTGWRLALHRGGGGNVSYPETTNDVIRELRQVFAADTSTAGLARTERSQRPSQPNEEIQSSDPIQRPSAAGASSTATDLQAIVTYWCRQLCVGGKWLHPDDEHVLLREPHSFNLDFPAGQYVGGYPPSTGRHSWRQRWLRLADAE